MRYFGGKSILKQGLYENVRVRYDYEMWNFLRRWFKQIRWKQLNAKKFMEDVRNFLFCATKRELTKRSLNIFKTVDRLLAQNKPRQVIPFGVLLCIA
jgi:hypothetical protein